MPHRDWHLLPHFVIRTTGFPFEWIEGLAFTRTCAALDELLAAENSLLELKIILRRELEAALRAAGSAELRRRLHRARECAYRDQPVADADLPLDSLCEWNAAQSALGECRARAESVFQQELAARRQRLRQVIEHPRFQQAIFLSSPQMYTQGVQAYLARADHDRRDAEIKRLERQFVTYLQRLCAKAETAAFFGPIHYGEIRESDGPRVTFRFQGAHKLERCEVFIAQWGVEALAQACAHAPEVQPWLRPRRSSLCQIREGRAGLVGLDREWTMDSLDLALLRHAEGERTIADLAKFLGLPVEELAARLARLEARRLVYCAPAIPSTAFQPLDVLRNFIAHLPACAIRNQWQAQLDRLESLRAEFAQAPLTRKVAILADVEQMVRELAGQPVRRAGGQFYADRTLIYEECRGSLAPFVLGSDMTRELEEGLSGVLALLAAQAWVTYREEQKAGLELLAELSRDHTSVDYARFARELAARAQDGRWKPIPPRSAAWLQHVRTALQGHEDERHVRFDRTDLPLPELSQAEGEAWLASPDVMLAARNAEALARGDYQLILSECHDAAMVWGWAIGLHERREQVEAALARELAELPGAERLASFLPGRRSKIAPMEYRGHTVEVLGLSAKAASQRIALADVQVTAEGDHLELAVPSRGLRLRAHHGELATLAHRLVSPPRVSSLAIDAGAHTPRLEVDRVVFQRETWHLPRAALLPGRYPGTSLQLFLDVWRARAQLGLPRYCFVRVPGERKPLFVDWANYFLLEMLDYFVKPGCELQISEMLPGPDQLWLQDEEGHYCCELRLTAIYRPQGQTSRAEGPLQREEARSP